MSISCPKQCYFSCSLQAWLAWSLYPHTDTLKYPGLLYTINDTNTDTVAPSYAIETGSFTLDRFQMISDEGIKLQTSPGRGPEVSHVYNGITRIYEPDGSEIHREAFQYFEGLVHIDIDLNESHFSKAALNDFGGHYMRPDRIRLVVDTDRKSSVGKVTGSRTHKVITTLERVGLNKPLEDEVEGAERK